jgi:hypothetical protein
MTILCGLMPWLTFSHYFYMTLFVGDVNAVTGSSIHLQAVPAVAGVA